MTSHAGASSASTRLAVAPTPDRGAAPQPPLLVLGGVRVLLGLLDVLDGDEALELALLVDDQQLLDAVLVQQLLRLGLASTPSGTVTSLRVITALDRLLEVRLEAHVAVGEDADQRLPSGDRDAGDAVLRASARAPRERRLGRDGDRVDDHAALGLLDLGTSRACCSMVMFLWMTPMPPSRAMAMAVRASVTVSIAAETIGMFSRMLRVRRVRRLDRSGGRPTRRGGAGRRRRSAPGAGRRG